MRARIALVGLGVLLALAPSAQGQDGWALWERPVDPRTGQPGGDWQRRQTFEAERWCRGEMTRSINRTLGAQWKDGRWNPRAKVLEFQCLPETEDPRRPTAK